MLGYKCQGEADYSLLSSSSPLPLPLPPPMAAQEVAKFEAKRLAEEVQAQRMELQAKDAKLKALMERTRVKLRAKDRELRCMEAELEDLKRKTSDALLHHQEESAKLRK